MANDNQIHQLSTSYHYAIRDLERKVQAKRYAEYRKSELERELEAYNKDLSDTNKDIKDLEQKIGMIQREMFVLLAKNFTMHEISEMLSNKGENGTK